MPGPAQGTAEAGYLDPRAGGIRAFQEVFALRAQNAALCGGLRDPGQVLPKEQGRAPFQQQTRASTPRRVNK